MALTIRNILIDNLRDRREPSTVTELARMSKVSRETITKMQDGDYGNVHYASIEKVFSALGYRVTVTVAEKCTDSGPC